MDGLLQLLTDREREVMSLVAEIVWLLVWAGLVIGAVYLLRRRPRQPDPDSVAAAALAERYARGEIDEDQYRTRLRVLRER